MTGWELGIDFGTSYTVAAIAQGGAINVVDIESDGRARIPSSIFLTQDGEILVGTAAQHQAVFAPERYEPTPKRSLGEGHIFLGDGLVSVTDLVAAVLRRVYTEACRQQGERAPSLVRVTHPAEWRDTRLSLLREATDKAGLTHVAFVPEPVAAAARIALESTEPGQFIAVYDFGGGTFDAAVLLRTADGFEVAGPPAGRDPLGGEDIDNNIIDYLGQVLADDDPESWRDLRNPRDVAWRRNAAAFRTEVQKAKETLSEITVCQLWVPGLERDVQLTRAELDKLITDDVGATVDTLLTAVRNAGLGPDRLAAVYLVGGSSRIPLVADTLWRRLGMRPSVQDNPKSVVAMGAAAWTSRPRRTDAAPVIERRSEPLAVPYRSPLAMAMDAEAWPGGCDCTAQIVVDHVGAPRLTLRARNEPADASTAEELAHQVLAVRGPRTPGFRETWAGPASVLGLADGFERRFLMDVAGRRVTMFEQYALIDGRALVVAAPEDVRSVARGLVFATARLPASVGFESRFELPAPPDWSMTEQLALVRRGTGHIVRSNCLRFPGSVEAGAWRQNQLGQVAGYPGAKVISQAGCRILGVPDGELLTVGWNDRGTAMLTKLGVAVLPGLGLGLAVVISLPHSEQALFPALVNHAHLHQDLDESAPATLA